MNIDRELLAQHLDDVASIRESIRAEFKMTSNPGLPAVFQELQTAVRCLENAEAMLDGLMVQG